ncbi:MAG TPA: 50S ribosomal protein L29 [Steroidobacteraceae bacterium]|nr:50S ribosomal protein L29 [Steroidobacteraceae bacterium]
MKAKELRTHKRTDLNGELMKLRREQFNLRMSAAAGAPARPDQWSKVRRNIARIKTVLGELERSGGAK